MMATTRSTNQGKLSLSARTAAARSPSSPPPKPGRAKLTKVRVPPKTRVFVSFDFDYDRVLRDFVIGQAKLADSPFHVANWSLKEAAPSRTWKLEAERHIAHVEVMLVMVGPHTHRAPGVLAEVAIAKRLGIPVRQVIGYRDANPRPVANAGRLYRWRWATMKSLLAKRSSGAS